MTTTFNARGFVVIFFFVLCQKNLTQKESRTSSYHHLILQLNHKETVHFYDSTILYQMFFCVKQRKAKNNVMQSEGLLIWQ